MSEKTILLVEDNLDDELLTLIALKENRISNEVIVAHDGVEALAYLHGTGPYRGRDVRLTPTLVLLDVKLPKVDGIGVLKRMRDDPRTHLVPVVMLTSSNEEHDVVSAYQNGANSYVRKPVHFAEFAEAARNLGLYWLTLNQVAPVA